MLKLVSVFSSTFIIETVFILIVRKDKKWIIPSFICNVCTNPLLNLLLSQLMINDVDHSVYVLCVALLEISAVIYEGYIYYYMLDIKRKEAFTTSFAANALSFLLGVIYQNVVK